MTNEYKWIVYNSYTIEALIMEGILSLDNK